MALPEGRGFGVGRGFLARYYTAYWKWRFSFTRYKYQAFLYTVSSIRSVTSTRVSFSLIYLRGSWLPNSYLFQAATWTIFRQVARNLTKPCCCINNNKMFEYITTISLILTRNSQCYDFTIFLPIVWTGFPRLSLLLPFPRIFFVGTVMVFSVWFISFAGNLLDFFFWIIISLEQADPLNKQSNESFNILNYIVL